MKENIVYIRNFLYKSFIIGFLLLVVFGILYIFLRESVSPLVTAWYGIPEESYYQLAVYAFGLFKILLFTLFLIPALALHCCCKCKKDSE